MFLSLLYIDVGDDPARPQAGRKWLRDIYRVHQRLWMAFPGEERRAEGPFFLGAWDGPAIPDPKPRRCEAGFLFRVERDGSARILVQSAQCPDWEYAFQNAPYLLAGDPKVRTFNPAPQRDQVYRFRLVANVVRSKRVVYSDGRMRTTRAGLTLPHKRRTEILVHPKPLPDPLPLGHSEREQLLRACWDPWREWLNDLGVGRGFCVVDDKTSPLLMEAVDTSVRNAGKNSGDSDQHHPLNWRYNAGLFNGVLVCTDPDRLRDAVVNGIGPGKAYGCGLLSIAPFTQEVQP